MSETSFGASADDYPAPELLGQYDAPAYVRRARGVESALEELLARCRAQREEWLLMVRLRLGRLKALAGGWAPLGPLLADAGQLELLEGLERELAPRLRLPVAPTDSPRRLRQALGELIGSLERFNRLWAAHLKARAAGPEGRRLDQLRDGYNRYYLVEKECALRSGLVARLGYRPLAPLSAGELAAHLPPLPVPRPREG